MPVQSLQRLIYRKLNRPNISGSLDRFGNAVNQALIRAGIPLSFATGLTRNKAILFASSNPAEILKARKSLLASDRIRAQLAVSLYDSGILEKSGIDPLKIKDIREELITKALESGLAPEQMIDLFGAIARGTTSSADLALVPYILEKIRSPKIAVAALSLFTHILSKTGSRSETLSFFSMILQKSVHTPKSKLSHPFIVEKHAVTNLEKVRPLLEGGKSVPEILALLRTFREDVQSQYWDFSIESLDI